MKNKKISAAPQTPILRYVLFAVLLFAAAIVAQIGDYMSIKTGGFIGAAAIVAMLFLANAERCRRLLTPVSFAMMAYMLLAGLSTLYARSGKFAIAEYGAMLTAYAVFMGILLFAKEGEISFRRTAAVIAAAAASVGILSIDAASCNILMRPFRAIAFALNSEYGDITGTYFYSRLHTIFGNPNLYAGFLSIAVLLSLWLQITAKTRRQQILCGILLTVNTVSYLLAFSMGSLGFFAAAALLMLALCPKETRMSFFLLLFQTAVIALLTTGIAVRGFGAVATGSPVPMLALAVGCVLFCLLDVFVRPKITGFLAGKGKLILICIAVLIAAAIVYLIAALQVTGPFTFGFDPDIRRTADLSAGDYTLSVQASAPVNIRVAYKNTSNLIQNNDTELAVGTSDAPITFTVPEDSRLVFFTFQGSRGTVIESATYEGAASGSINLGYKLLPEFIADRIQDLSANGNVVQRGVYRQDALRLFMTAPIFGRGLGGFENGIVSVQDYYYETSHAHNHYVEVMCNLGILGLLAYLSILGTAIWCLVRSRKQKPLMVMVLAACVLQMFGQAVTDLTWSVGGCMVLFFSILAMIALYCGDTLRLKVPGRSRLYGVRLPVGAVMLAFVIMIGLNLYAQTAVRKPTATLDTLKSCAAIDLFEKNDYKLSYLISGGQNDDPELAASYAADLQREESNSITIPLAQYYASTGQFDAALDTLEQGARYMRADEEVWQQLFSLYEAMIDPVGNLSAAQLLEEKARYVDRMIGTYNALCQVNASQLDTVDLTSANNLFLGKLLAVGQLEEGDVTGALEIFSKMLFDTASAPDANADGLPDYLRITQGSLQGNGDGSFTAVTDAVVEIDLTIKSSGQYTLQVQSSTPIAATMYETPVAFDQTGTSQIFEQNAEETSLLVLQISAGTTVENLRYAKS